MSDFILERWEQQAVDHGLAHTTSWGDMWMIDLEIAEISSRLPADGQVHDVGCANGFSTERILDRVPGIQLTGVDFSPAMIAAAQERPTAPGLGIAYQVADVRDIPFEDDSFDAVYTTRTLINLPTWEEQKGAIAELLRISRPRGRVLLSEAFWEPLCKVNALRGIAGLAPLEEHDFNRYIKQHQAEAYLTGLGLDFTLVGFSSVYYLGSWFARELVTDVYDYAGYANPVNEAFFNLESQWSGGPFSV